MSKPLAALLASSSRPVSAVILWVAAAGVFAGAAQTGRPQRTAADGVYSQAQAMRGQQAFETNCASCHRPDLSGGRGPQLVADRFAQNFGDTPVGSLFGKIKKDMPAGAPGSLPDATYLDVTSYILQKNSFPSGTAELTADIAAATMIPGGGAPGLVNYDYVTTVGCLQQDATRSWLLTKSATLEKAEPGGARAPSTGPTGSGAFTFRLLDAYNRGADAHKGHKMKVTGHMVRQGAEIRVNVSEMQMVAATCD